MKRWFLGDFQIIAAILALALIWITSIAVVLFRANLWTALNLLADGIVTTVIVYAIRQHSSRKTRQKVMDFQAEFLRRLTRGHDLTSVLDPVVNAAASRYPKSGIAVSLIFDTEKSQRLEVAGEAGLPAPVKTWIESTSLRKPDTPEALCFLVQECVVLTNAPSDVHWDTYGGVLEPYGFSACWVQPVLNWDGKVVGFLSVYPSKSTIPSSYDEKVLKSFSAAFGLAVDKVKIDEQYHQFAYQDPLTGLGNRRQFIQSLEMSIEDARKANTSFSLLWLDLDKFKDINDTFGHETGDKVLVEVGSRILETVPDSSSLARMGGDEFAILLLEHELFEAAAVADRLLEAICQPMNVDSHIFIVTGSLGVTSYPEHGHDAGELMRHADVAMYQVKGSGRGGVQVYGPAKSIT